MSSKRGAKRAKVDAGAAADSRIVFDLSLLKEDDHQALATKYKATALADVPDDALAAECARRNLQIVSGEDGCSVEALIAQRYTKVKLLGTGSSGTVYEVFPVADEAKRFALKTMLKGTGNAEGYENTDEDMALEVSYLKRLHHPCVGSCVEVFESPTAFHLVLEEMKGGEVHDFLGSHAAFTEDEARGMAVQILAAIEYLQLHGIAHRDIKVENVLLVEPSPTSAVKIADFGLAHDVSKDEGHHAKYNGSCAKSIKACRSIAGEEYYGTLATMAPEVMRDGGCYGPQCDVYSAGCVIYSLLSGFYPFDATTADEFEEIVKGRPADAPAPVEYAEWDDVSDGAKAFLQSVMAHDPAERLTAAEALQHPWLQQSGGGAGKKLGWKKGCVDRSGGKKKKTLDKTHKSRHTGKHTHIAKKDHICTTSTE
jgi:serine/threonine protein kinase